MTIQMSVALANARANLYDTYITSGTLCFKVFTGSLPANCAAADTGTMLGQGPIDSGWLANAANGIASFSFLGFVGTNANITPGNIGYFRMYASDNTTCHLQGTATAYPGDGALTFLDGIYFNGWLVSINSFSFIESV